MALIVVAYDITSDRRRARLHALLLGYGEPVQESLFECELTEAKLRRLRTALKRTVRPTDNVRLYPVCADCATRIEVAGGAPRPSQLTAYVA